MKVHSDVATYMQGVGRQACAASRLIASTIAYATKAARHALPVL